jgi:hypothetical protein
MAMLKYLRAQQRRRLPAGATHWRLGRAVLWLCLVLALLPWASARVRCAMWLGATAAWFEHRPAAIVLCGDSHLHDLPPSLLWQQWGVARHANLARAGAVVVDLIAQLAEARRLQSARLVVMAGANDDASADADWAAAWHLVFSMPMGKWVPKRVVVAQPWTADHRLDEQVGRRNLLLAQMAKAHGWIFLDPSFAMFDGSALRVTLFRAATHFSSAGYARWFAVIAPRL